MQLTNRVEYDTLKEHDSTRAVFQLDTPQVRTVSDCSSSSRCPQPLTSSDGEISGFLQLGRNNTVTAHLPSRSMSVSTVRQSSQYDSASPPQLANEKCEQFALSTPHTSYPEDHHVDFTVTSIQIDLQTASD